MLGADRKAFRDAGYMRCRHSPLLRSEGLANPHGIRLTFVGTCALMFGVGADLTDLVFKLTEDMP
jgi:hypothetical protein